MPRVYAGNARPVFYHNDRFRSRTEARHAVFLDVLGVPYSYELEGVVLAEDSPYAGDASSYLCDFVLRRDPAAWYETKPRELPYAHEVGKLAEAVAGFGMPGYIGFGDFPKSTLAVARLLDAAYTEDTGVPDGWVRVHGEWRPLGDHRPSDVDPEYRILRRDKGGVLYLDVAIEYATWAVCPACDEPGLASPRPVRDDMPETALACPHCKHAYSPAGLYKAATHPRLLRAYRDASTADFPGDGTSSVYDPEFGPVEQGRGLRVVDLRGQPTWTPTPTPDPSAS